MPRKDEERMPATRGELIRYFQKEGNGVKISPKSVLYFTAGIIIFVMFLHIAGRGLLGF